MIRFICAASIILVSMFLINSVAAAGDIASSNRSTSATTARIESKDSRSPDATGQISSDTVMIDRLGPIVVGQDAPLFGGQLTDGKVIGLRQLINKEGTGGPSRVLVLNFFTTVCAPCLAGLKAITAAEADIKRMNAEILLIAAGEGDAKVRAFMKRHKFDLPVFADSYHAVSSLYGALEADGKVRVPVTVIIDGNGKIRAIVSEEGSDFIEILKTKIITASDARQ